jgi:hypothetical protein
MNAVKWVVEFAAQEVLYALLGAAFMLTWIGGVNLYRRVFSDDA